MTFTEIVTEILERLHLTSAEATTRVGRAVNRIYGAVTTSVGLDTSRNELGVTGTVGLGLSEVTFSGMEKVLRVFETSSGRIKELKEVTLFQMREENPGTGVPTKWAVVTIDSDSVLVRVNTVAQEEITLYADGYTSVSTLSGSDVPVIPKSFHDILIDGVLKDEYQKLEKWQAAHDANVTYKERLSDLRLFIAKSAYKDLFQAASKPLARSGSGSGSGSSSSGSSSYVQTGLITFDRDPSAPFAVTDGSAYVANLFAEGIGNVTSDRIIGRDTAGTGESEQLTVSGGIEFTGSGGIQTSAFTGDVTKSAGGTVLTIANDAVTDAKLRESAALSVIGRSANSTGNPADISAGSDGEVLRRSGTTLSFGTVATAGITDDAVTYAKIQNVSAASRLLGRGAGGGAGNTEEITVASPLSFTTTELNFGTQSANVVFAGPTSGGAAAPTFRAIVAADLPAETVRVIDRDVVVNTISNSTTPTTVYSFSVPANTIGSTRKLRLVLIGETTNNTGGAANLTTTAAFGGSTIFNSGAFSLATNANARYYRMVIEVSAKNATNSQATYAELLIGNTATFNGTNVAGPQHEAGQGNTTAIDTTSNQTLSVTVTLGTASSSFTYSLHTAILELV